MSSNPSPSLEIIGSRQLNSWFSEQNLSLCFTTYQAGKVFWVGLESSGKLSVFERTLNRCMGLWATEQTLYISSLYQLWRFENILEKGQLYQNYDRVFVPQVGYITGDLDIHDVVVDDSERLIFVNTLFSCLGTVSEKHSFIPLWQPPFISKLAAEDRCHLNGLALREGKPRYVSAVSRSDITEGWRDRRLAGGCVIDINTNQILAHGLSMPHSPRWYQDRLWLLNSGTGELGYLDLETGTFEAVTFCPGYLRGCAFHGDFALVGISKPRENRTFLGLPLNEKLKQKDAQARCGVLIIDLRSGDIVHSLRIEGVVSELYDVAVLPGVQRSMAIGFKSDEICRVITIGNS